jgi:dipeptidyl aminopeptidase/acylaminoacyl peptidase
MGTPYENLKLFQERSPVAHVKNVKTPTLLLTGENDAIDPIGQCQQFYRGLRRYGVETEFVIYPREGHGIREEQHRIDQLNRIIAWFDKHMGTYIPGIELLIAPHLSFNSILENIASE